MGSYRDWLLIENPNELSESDLRKAVSSMSSVANKRLKRMQNRSIFFGDDKGDETLSGVRKFSVRGKTLSEVKREFKRVKNNRCLNISTGELIEFKTGKTLEKQKAHFKKATNFYLI